jgi:hypothetical protein
MELYNRTLFLLVQTDTNTSNWYLINADTFEQIKTDVTTADSFCVDEFRNQICLVDTTVTSGSTNITCYSLSTFNQTETNLFESIDFNGYCQFDSTGSTVLFGGRNNWVLLDWNTWTINKTGPGNFVKYRL